jgi:hypothetical protein
MGRWMQRAIRSLKEHFMSKKIEYSNEPVNLEVIDDSLPSTEELAAIDPAWLEEVQRRSAEFDAGRMKSFPAEEVFKRAHAHLNDDHIV